MSKRVFAPATLVVAAFIFTLGLIIGPSGVIAQGEPPSRAETTGPVHPAHIHEGTCSDLGDVVYPLDEVRQMSIDVATPDPTIREESDVPDEADEGAGDSESFSQSITPNVEASLDDLLASEHAINVHESEENIENYIACGEITGTVSQGTLIIELQELNGSGFSGEAVLTEGADDGTSVTITLTQSGSSATPAATP